MSIRRHLLPLAALLPVLVFVAPDSVCQPMVNGEVQAGFHGGPSLQTSFVVSKLAQGFPWNIRVSVGRSQASAGRAEEARSIFINDATNGVPEKSGRQWDYALDFLVPVNLINLERTYLLFGPRHVQYAGNFKYVGGNEDFDITSHQWGLGLGLQTYFSIGGRSALTLGLGMDHYFKATLYGHDTSYSPDGDHVNPRNDYDYDDADEAVDQPTQELRAMLGLSYRL